MEADGAAEGAGADAALEDGSALGVGRGACSSGGRASREQAVITSASARGSAVCEVAMPSFPSLHSLSVGLSATVVSSFVSAFDGSSSAGVAGAAAEVLAGFFSCGIRSPRRAASFTKS